MYFILIFATLFFSAASSFLPGQCHSKSCLNGGTCYRGKELNTHWCSCPDRFTGSRCEDLACPDICRNGGKCFRKTERFGGDHVDYACHCPIGFHGRYCEQASQESICKRESPCGQHGRCHLTTSLHEYQCSCHKGWKGLNCTERDPCPSDHCKNGGRCQLSGSTVSCDCPANFEGERCERDVDECTKNPCIHGTCINEHGSFRCVCDRGFVGDRCELPRATSECSLRGRATCRNGGVCTLRNNAYECICPPMYEGFFCERDVNECDTLAPCQNGGTCVNTDGGYTCICPNGYEGASCERDHDDCAGNPCSLGSTCIDGIAMYTCQCPIGRTGVRCELVDRCETQRPCNNGRCITDVTTGDFTCECERGFQGLHCDEDIDECGLGDNLCYNNGTCVNTPGSYHCQCNKPFVGRHCDQLMSSCDPNPCLNHGTCIDHIESFICVCKAGFSGAHCEVHGATCPEEECLNGGVCDNDVCICPSGFHGMFCEERGVPCGVQTCRLNQICDESGNVPVCTCPAGYYGIDCQLRHNPPVDCSLNPCLHGECTDVFDGYTCTCPKGYDGINCEMPVNHCNSTTCSNGGSCLHDINGFICHCVPPYYGKDCEKESDPCANNPCGANAVCKPSADYSTPTCECKKGYQGESCDEDIDECSSSPCLHGGVCENSFGSSECKCPPHYTGHTCERKIDFCTANPCANNGTCVDDASGFVCICPPGFSGKTCQSDIDDCITNPCVNGASCIDGTDTYRCKCAPGFSGRNCEINVDDCKPKGLCLNGGSCVDDVNTYKCHCSRGFTGSNCQTFVDIDQYNHTDKLERDRCLSRDCPSKASNGVCDEECNFFGCSYDGGDCSAKSEPYQECPSASYCARVFADRKCDQICNSESCLFDGFDCDFGSASCAAEKFCQRHFGDGRCDQKCNSRGCGYDGGDCERTEEDVLSGDVVLVVLTPPDEFVSRVNRFLMTVSSSLRASVRIRTDSEGPMVFEWKDGETGDRLKLKEDQILSVSFGGMVRSRRDVASRGVILWLKIDVSSCRGECFTDIGTVASYLGRAQARQDLSQLGMPIHLAIARRPSMPEGEVPATSSFFAILLAGMGLMMIVGCIYVLQQQQRTRKRRMITAPAWIPPTEAQNKQFLHQQTDHALRLSLYGSHGDIYNSCKRTKLDMPPAMNYYHPDGFDGVPLPAAMKQNVVTVKPPAPKHHPDPADVHFEAASNEGIKTPIDPSQVNARAGVSGRTPLIWLADNASKPIDIVLEDVQKLYNAGAHLNMQDDDEETALFVACRGGRLELVRKLLELGSDPCLMNNKNSTCLHQAAHNGDVEMVEELLKRKEVVKEINEVDIFDRTALMVSAMNDVLSTRVAEVLLKAGADASYPGDKSSLTYKGRTALHYAAQYSNTKMMKFLIAQGANRDAQDLEDCTPLFLAAKEGRLEAVLTLVEAGASTEITDQKERTPREMAEDQHFADIVEALTPHGESVVPLPMSIGKSAAAKPAKTTKQVKRVAVKRKSVQQPLTPPHSDGVSTPSPSDVFQLGRPLLCPTTQGNNSSSVLDSPGSDPTNSSREDKYSPQGGNILSTPGYWSGTYMKPSPPYEEQHSELGLGGASYYSNQGNPFGTSFDYPSFNVNDRSQPNLFPPCQYTQQRFHQV